MNEPSAPVPVATHFGPRVVQWLMTPNGFRTIVAGNFLLFVIWLAIESFAVVLYEPLTLDALSWREYDAVFTLSPQLRWLLIVLWVPATAGLLVFAPEGRWLTLGLLAVEVGLSPFSGIDVIAPGPEHLLRIGIWSADVLIVFLMFSPAIHARFIASRTSGSKETENLPTSADSGNIRETDAV